MSSITRSIAVGPSKGHKFTKVVKPHHKKYHKRLHRGQKHLIRDTIREICGYAPYEKRVLELLRNGFDRRALRLCKRKVKKHKNQKRINAVFERGNQRKDERTNGQWPLSPNEGMYCGLIRLSTLTNLIGTLSSPFHLEGWE